MVNCSLMISFYENLLKAKNSIIIERTNDDDDDVDTFQLCTFLKHTHIYNEEEEVAA